MRTACAIVAALALAGCASIRPKPEWDAPPPPIATGPVVPAERLHRTVLENGLAVLILEDHSLPRLTIGVSVRRGAASEPLAEAGAAGMTLDVMKRGAGSRDAFALALAVEQMGASLSAGAGWDSASVGIGGLAEDADALFAILADVVRRPRFDAGEVARARAEQLAAFEREKADPNALAGRAFANALYDGHRFGTSADGTPASVAKMDAALLRRWHARLFTPAQAMIYVVGDLGRDEALARVRAAFGDWPAAPGLELGEAPPATTPPARRVVLVDRPEQQQALLMLGHEGISRRDPERVAVDVMNDILGGGGFLSRLMSKLRADEGLAYGVGSSFLLRWHPGPFVLSTSTRVAEAGRVVDLLLAEMAGMHDAPPTDADVRRIQSFSAGRFVLGLETSAAIAGSLVDLDVYGLPEDALDTYRTRLAAVTRDDVVHAAETRLHPERLVIVAVGPAAALRPQLERFGPVEVFAP